MFFRDSISCEIWIFLSMAMSIPKIASIILRHILRATFNVRLPQGTNLFLCMSEKLLTRPEDSGFSVCSKVRHGGGKLYEMRYFFCYAVSASRHRVVSYISR